MADRAVLQNRTRPNYINDIDKLVAIAGILEKNPAMKRTTAIRALGIEDPTTIRRLRKKLPASLPKNLSANLETKSLEDNISALKVISQQKISRVRTKSADLMHSKKGNSQSKFKKAENTEAQKQSVKPPSKSEKPDLMTCMFAANLAAGQALFQIQFKMWSFAFQASPIACYLRNQELLRLTLQNIKATTK